MNLNLSKILKPYQNKNKWVALSPDYRRVVSSGDTLQEVLRKLNKKEKEKVIFHKVLPVGYIPFRI